MTSKVFLGKKLLGMVLCCGASQLSIAQRTAPEPPLAPIQSQVQLHASTVQVVATNADTTVNRVPPASVRRVTESRPQPIFLLNSEVIIAPDGIQPAEIKKIVVYKGGDAPAQWHDLVTYGIIDIASKQKTKIKSRTLSAVGKDLGLLEPVRYTINAMPVAAADLRIALDAIGEIKITRATPEAPVATVAISVRPPKPSPPDPPGTIRIR